MSELCEFRVFQVVLWITCCVLDKVHMILVAVIVVVSVYLGPLANFNLNAVQIDLFPSFVGPLMVMDGNSWSQIGVVSWGIGKFISIHFNINKNVQLIRLFARVLHKTTNTLNLSMK